MAYGRPKKQFSKEQFEALCQIMCTQTEIESVLGADHKTINKWCLETYGKTYSQAVKEKSDMGRMSLRRYQFNLAKTSATMAIFLGKQHLNQKDVYNVDDAREDNNKKYVEELTKQLCGRKVDGVDD